MSLSKPDMEGEENALERFKTGFSAPDVSLRENVMQYLIFLSKVVSLKSKD